MTITIPAVVINFIGLWLLVGCAWWCYCWVPRLIKWHHMDDADEIMPGLTKGLALMSLHHMFCEHGFAQGAIVLVGVTLAVLLDILLWPRSIWHRLRPEPPLPPPPKNVEVQWPTDAGNKYDGD